MDKLNGILDNHGPKCSDDQLHGTSPLEDLCSLEFGPHGLACMAYTSGPIVVDIITS